MPYGHASMLLLGEGSEATEPYNKYDKIRQHSIRSLQFDQKVRPLSFRPEKPLQPPLENAQRRATRLIPSLVASRPYEQRLMKLELPTLDFRRKWGRVIEVYKILKGVYDKRVTGG